MHRVRTSSDDSNLAQRWEEPSTAHQERIALRRAKRLCAKAESDGLRRMDPVSEVSLGARMSLRPVLTFPSWKERCKEFIQNKFWATIFDWGIRRSSIQHILENIPCDFWHDVQSSLQILSSNIMHNKIQSSEQGREGAASLTMSCNVKHDKFKWNKKFIQDLCGTSGEDFARELTSCNLPLPCTPFQFLCFFIDASLCFEEGLRSWQR
jgi:hypothetical protein